MAKGHGSGSRLRRSGLAGLVTVALVAFLAACSSGSDTATTRTGNEDTTAFCNTYDELSRTSLNHNTGDPATNEESWKKHLALAKELVEEAPSGIAKQAQANLAILKARAQLAREHGYANIASIPGSDLASLMSDFKEKSALADEMDTWAADNCNTGSDTAPDTKS